MYYFPKAKETEARDQKKTEGPRGLLSLSSRARTSVDGSNAKASKESAGQHGKTFDTFPQTGPGTITPLLLEMCEGSNLKHFCRSS